MLRAVVIDDETVAINALKKIARANDEIEIIAGYTDPLKGLEGITIIKPDVVFLDISMPEISGIYLAEEIVRISPDIGIVFVTSYNDYAIKAFDLNAMDYLLKPVTLERFNQCVSKLLCYGNKKISQQNIHNLNCQYRESVRKLFVDNNEETILLKLEDICYFKVENKTVLIRTFDNTYTSSNSLSFFEAKLHNSNFYRCHRSYMVNLDQVSRLIYYSKNSCELGFPNIKDTVPVSKRNLCVLQKLLQY